MCGRAPIVFSLERDSSDGMFCLKPNSHSLSVCLIISLMKSCSGAKRLPTRKPTDSFFSFFSETHLRLHLRSLPIYSSFFWRHSRVSHGDDVTSSRTRNTSRWYPGQPEVYDDRACFMSSDYVDGVIVYFESGGVFPHTIRVKVNSRHSKQSIFCILGLSFRFDWSIDSTRNMLCVPLKGFNYLPTAIVSGILCRRPRTRSRNFFDSSPSFPTTPFPAARMSSSLFAIFGTTEICPCCRKIPQKPDIRRPPLLH